MGNQQLQINESQSNISQYYQKMLNINKENIPYQYQKTPKLARTDSKNKLRPTSKVNLDLKLGSRSSEKYLNGVSQVHNTLMQQLFLETPHVSNPLEKLQRKRSSTKIVQENDESHIQLLELLKNMVRHQDSTMQSSQDKVTEQSCQEYKKTMLEKQEAPLEDRPLQFNFSVFNRKRSKTFEESFKTLISNEDRCQPCLRKESQDEQALQFILQNCTQTQSRVDQQRSNSITFESLESDWQAMTKKNSKQLETPGTAQFQGFNNKDDKIFELSTSNFMEMNNEDIGSRRPSCVESSFLIPMVLHSQNSLDFDDSKEIQPRMIGIQKPKIDDTQMTKQLEQASNYSTRDGCKYQERKQVTKSQAFGLPNKAPFKHKSFHQQSELHLETAKTIISNIKNNITKTNSSFVQNIPQPSFTSKNTKSSCDSIQKSVKLSAYPEEQWLKNSKLEYKKIMLVLDDQQKMQNFSIQNQNEMISNTFTSSEIDISQRYYQEDLNYRIKPLQEDKNTQTQLKELQKDFIQRLSQPKYKNSSRMQEQNPYWKIREIDSTKRTKRK